MLTIGTLTNCPDCTRRRLEPGAEYCPDCTIMARLHRKLAFEVEHLMDNWGDSDFLYEPMYKLRQDASFQSYATVAEFYYECMQWEQRNLDKLNRGGRRCPECGHLLD